MSSAGGEQMPKLDAKELPMLSSTQKRYMQVIEEQNAKRASKLLQMRRRNNMVGSFLGLSVLAIYGYSIFSVKQEKFLDELED